MKLYNYLFFLFVTAYLFGCQDVLDKRNLNVVDDKIIWEDETMATLYINSLYAENMPTMSLGTNSPMSDETYSSSSTYTDILYGFVTPSDIDAINVLHRDKYQLIRRINIGVQGLAGSNLDEVIKAPIKGQALFLRAFRYWEMVKLYGGIPMVLKPQDPFKEDLDIERSKTIESINIIVSDLDEAIAGLPIEWELEADKGRITSGAAAAFKARVLLSWASPLFNPDNKQDRWQRAYKASQEAVELLGQMSVPRDLHPDFSTIFTSNVALNVEAVIYKTFNLSAGTEFTNGWEGSVRPTSTSGSPGGTNPTWELVKAFPMANGKHILEQESGYDSIYFWHNRDPRFYASIAYNGCEWDMDGRESGQKQWTYTRNIHENNWSPATGFLCRKATNPNIKYADVGQTNTTWHELRYAEVLLNLAECANEVGNTNEAIQIVRRIRERAGILSEGGTFGVPDGLSKQRLLEIIMIERQVEFAFENKRYWDIRRRLLFRNDLGEFAKKLNGTQRHGLQTSAKSPWSRRVNVPETSPFYGWNRIDTAVYNHHVDINDADNYNTYFSTSYRLMEAVVNSEPQSFNYLPLYDYFAVGTDFLQKSPAVTQTLGWLDGTFDPLAE